MFAIIQITSPAGAATLTALPKTNRVRSRIERTITLPICGLRYGGSSSVKDEGIPFKIVTDKSFEMKKVISIPKTMTPVSINVETKD